MTQELPALLGGVPVRSAGPPAWPLPDDEVTQAVQSALADGSWGLYHGPHVAALEAALGPGSFTCASGTVAVEVALRACGVGPGDEVILGAYDYEPSFLSIHALGATPVLVDVQEANVCLDPLHVARAITPRTKAILATHLHGGLADVAQLVSLAKAHGVRVVEDAAQMPSVPWQGDIGILSFGGSKLLTAGRGGALLVRDPALAQRVKLALQRGIQQFAPLSELQAAALLPQWHRLPQRAEHRRQQVQYLATLLRDIPGLRLFTNILAGAPDYYKVGFFYDAASFGLPRDLFVKALRAEGMAFDVGFRALHVGRAASRYKAATPLTHAENAGQQVVLLHHPVLALTATDVAEVAIAVRKTYRNAAHLVHPIAE